jgi:orotidine-5'-phosphate decarboxylase
MPSGSDPRVFVALDFADADSAIALAMRLDPHECGIKVGSELFTAAGPEFVTQIVARGFNVFLDLKFHDIPNTVAGACAAATRLGVFMLNVHAAGGRAMLSAAREAVDQTARGRSIRAPRLIAVTVLTSLDAASLQEVGQDDSVLTQAMRLGALARDSGLDGVVCSAAEAGAMRKAFGNGFVLVTPGIRPVDAGGDDQSRIATPAAALASGADYLVVGRPITRAADPLAALAQINRSLGTMPG